jgi:hypothetical protein
MEDYVFAFIRVHLRFQILACSTPNPKTACCCYNTATSIHNPLYNPDPRVFARVPSWRIMATGAHRRTQPKEQ